jgi:hypothetical protein
VELRRTLLVLLAIALAGWVVYQWLQRRAERTVATAAEAALGAMPAAVSEPPARLAAEEEVFASAAARAWSYVESHYQPQTGMTRTVPEYAVATTWDIASMLAAYYGARELGLIDEADWDRRAGRLLETLAGLPLFEGAAFNKTYGTDSGRILERNDSPSVGGFGWSTTDLGRLLIWLRIVAAHDPDHAAAAERVARRIDLERIVRDGYLWSEERDRRGRLRSFPEGFIGYEQYAASGFALWGAVAERARSLTANTRGLTLWDDVVLIDRRPRSCLTSEPFILAGLEFGWSADMARLALAVLDAQESRHRRTGRITIASEDASTTPPWHFYYHCIYGDAGPFSLAVQGGQPLREGPLTVSAKAAFAWYVLTPTAYTARALETVSAAWGADSLLIAGLDEETGETVGPPNINTAAVILEAALYRQRGRPFLDLAGSGGG